MEILNTIVPIFAVIFIGWIARERGFLPNHFLEPANRLVFYFAIPAMIFMAIARSSFQENFNISVLLIGLFSMLLAYLISWAATGIIPLEKRSTGTFVQCSFHGNIGYMAFAVTFYFLGEEGFARAGLFSGFVIIWQNFLSVLVLSIYGSSSQEKFRGGAFISPVLLNPVIIASGLGILFSIFSIPLPLILSRSLEILGGMGLPLALLIIGGSLSFETLKAHFSRVAVTSLIKLFVLPGMAFFLYRLAGSPRHEYLPLLIILAAPTATVTYVMAAEMRGDKGLAAAAVSINTVLSSLTYILWLNFA